MAVCCLLSYGPSADGTLTIEGTSVNELLMRTRTQLGLGSVSPQEFEPNHPSRGLTTPLSPVLPHSGTPELGNTGQQQCHPTAWSVCTWQAQPWTLPPGSGSCVSPGLAAGVSHIFSRMAAPRWPALTQTSKGTAGQMSPQVRTKSNKSGSRITTPGVLFCGEA